MQFVRIILRWLTGRCTRCGEGTEPTYSSCTGTSYECSNPACSAWRALDKTP